MEPSHLMWSDQEKKQQKQLRHSSIQSDLITMRSVPIDKSSLPVLIIAACLHSA